MHTKNVFLILHLAKFSYSSLKCGISREEMMFAYQDPDTLLPDGKPINGQIHDYGFFDDHDRWRVYGSADKLPAMKRPDPEFRCQLENAMPDAYPWHVAIVKKADWSVKCSGVLIHPQWILTSGTCIVRKTVIVAGFANLKTLSIRIKLDHPFNITEQVLPICLPKTENFLLKESTKCVTTGFGMDKSDIRLQQQISQVRPHRDCEGNYKRASSTQRICLSMGCTCMENGMPLICKVKNGFSEHYVLAGIKVADGRTFSRRKEVTSASCGNVERLFVPTAPYLNWINAKIRPPKTSPNSVSLGRGHTNLDQILPVDRDLIDIITQIERNRTTSKPVGCQKTPSGSDYRGGAALTRYGFPCLQWHMTNKYTASNFPNAGLVKNYCRNPDKDPKGPWCFFYGPIRRKILFGYCNIPRCK